MRKIFEPFILCTGGNIKETGKQTIDHIFCSSDIEIENLFGISNLDNEIRLSDHFGIFASLKKNIKTANKS